jgi:hypothetical protein
MGLGTFELTAANGFQFIGTSINDILYALLSMPQVNTVVTRSAAKYKVVGISSDGELSIADSVELELDQERPNKQNRNASLLLSNMSLPSSSPLLPCFPPNLWHLCYGHAFSSTLRKLKGIKSMQLLLSSQENPTTFLWIYLPDYRKLRCVHLDICSQYPKLKCK